MKFYKLFLVASCSLTILGFNLPEDSTFHQQSNRPSVEKQVAGINNISFSMSLAALHQTEEAVVQEVRRMFTEVGKMTGKKCKDTKRVRYESLDNSDPQLPKNPYTQKVSVCTMDKGYEMTVGEFSGHEWAETVSVYKKDGKVFFVFVKGGSEGLEYERRFYCNTNETVVRRLDKEAEAGDDVAQATQEKIPLPAGNRSIYTLAENHFKDIRFVLTGK